MLNLIKKFFTKQTTIKIEFGETELDYINPYEFQPKKKSNPKQFDGVESDGLFVKTRKKPKK